MHLGEDKKAIVQFQDALDLQPSLSVAKEMLRQTASRAEPKPNTR